MPAKQYDVEKVAVVLDGLPITEFVDGESIRVELDEADWNFSQGTHGAVIRAKRPNNLATVTLSVMQGAPILDYLNTKRTADLLSPVGLAFSFGILDLNGRSLCTAPRACFVTAPPMIFGTDAAAREWEIKLFNPVFSHGGNTPA